MALLHAAPRAPAHVAQRRSRQSTRAPAVKATRRDAALLLASLPVARLAQHAGPAHAAGGLLATSSPPRAAACSRLDPTLAAAFMGAVYATVEQQQVVPPEQLQRERYKLQAQEYKYYAAANKDRLPVLPDLSDNAGGLDNRVYYNFLSYTLWKTVARHVRTPEQRTQFCAGVGQQLLQQLAPGTLQQVQQAAAAQQGGQVPAALLLQATRDLLSQLQAGGYLCGYQVVWGSLPGGWPGDWASSQPQLLGPDQQELQVPPSPGGQQQQQQQQQEQQQQSLEPGFTFQVKLLQPADIEGSVALRAEEDAFWSRHVSSMLAALFRAGGAEAVASEFFYQDTWSGPTRLADKLLLLLGDPLQLVDVPWTPTTLVQDWSIV